MVIIDVHDDTPKIIRTCSKYLKQLQKLQKDVVFAYIHSPDDACVHNASLHKTRHTHRDAGFSIWRASTATRVDIANTQAFTRFLSLLQATYAKYEYGADEVILDVFFNQSIPKARQILIANPFPSQCCGSQRHILDSFTSVTPHVAFDFHGRESMYICSRVG